MGFESPTRPFFVGFDFGMFLIYDYKIHPYVPNSAAFPPQLPTRLQGEKVSSKSAPP